MSAYAGKTVGRFILDAAHRTAYNQGRHLANPQFQQSAIDYGIDMISYLSGCEAGRLLSRKVGVHLNIDDDSLITQFLAAAIKKVVIKSLKGFVLTHHNVEQLLHWFNTQWDKLLGHDTYTTVKDELVTTTHMYAKNHIESHQKRRFHGVDGYAVTMSTCLMGSHSGRLLTLRVGEHFGIDHDHALELTASAVSGYAAEYFKTHPITIDTVDHLFDWIHAKWDHVHM